jgi:hypothetical protein
MVRGLLVLTAVAAASLSWLLAVTQAGFAVQGVRHARALAALLAIGGAVAMWGAVWAASGRNPFGRWRRTAERRTPRRLIAARIALILASLITLAMISSIPVPYRTREALAAFGALAAVAVAGITAAVLVTRRTPYGRWLTVALGIYAFVMAAWRLPSMLPVLGPDAGPGPVVLLLVVGSVWVGHIFAAACVLSLRGAWPENEAASDDVVSLSDAR